MLTNARRWPLLVVLLALMTLVVGACGNDDDDKEVSGGAAAPTTTAGGQAAAGNLTKYCEGAVALDTVPDPDLDFESLSPDQQKAEVKKFFNEKIQPLIPTVAENAPAEIKPDVDVLVATADKVGQTGDFSAFEEPDAKSADKRVHAFEENNCGYAKQDVKAVDYSFQGLTMNLKAGLTSFDFSNTGTEMHELQVLKRKDGVTESFDQILKLDEKQAKEKVEKVASIDPTKPGDSDYDVARLEKGQYLVACFLPKGATPAVFEKLESGGELPDAPPHFTLGMKNIITVA